MLFQPSARWKRRPDTSCGILRMIPFRAMQNVCTVRVTRTGGSLAAWRSMRSPTVALGNGVCQRKAFSQGVGGGRGGNDASGLCNRRFWRENPRPAQPANPGGGQDTGDADSYG